eukprot:5246411-Pyramimonas_sp.AAC.2
MFDGSVLDSFWGEVSLLTATGYNLLAMIEQIVVKHPEEDSRARKSKWDEFTELAFERQGPIAHEISKKTHAEPLPILEKGFADAALVGQPALDRVLEDWPPHRVGPVRANPVSYTHLTLPTILLV